MKISIEHVAVPPNTQLMPVVRRHRERGSARKGDGRFGADERTVVAAHGRVMISVASDPTRSFVDPRTKMKKIDLGKTISILANISVIAGIFCS